jgi:CO/xanthine dehydrogenase Mo-binding subunit
MVKLLADMLGLPESAVRVVVPFVGGAFGGKEYASVLPLAAVAARVIGRPVRLEYTAEESVRTVVRHAAAMTFRSAVDSGGRLLGRTVELLFDTGAYADQGPRVVRQAGYRSPGPYRIPNLQVDAYAVYTNKVPAGAYRGFGASQPIYACESHTDEIARELGMDPVEFRRRNLLALGDDFVAGDLPLDCDIPESLRVAVEEMRRPVAHPVPDPLGATRLRGVGFAVGVKNTASGHLPSTAIVRLHADGSATVQATSVELGQGTQTMITQVAAEALCVEPERVRVTSPDTAVTPFDQRTSSSRSTVHLGLAVLRAAEDACANAVRAAARLLDVPPGQLRLEGGSILGGPRQLPIGSLLKDPRAGFGGEIIGVGHFVPEQPDAPTAFGMRAGYWEGSVGAAEVAIDAETGEVELVRYVTVADAGRVINPVTAHGQEEGGAVMAIGHALFEACVFEDGAFLNPSLVDYRLPTVDDVPVALTSRFLERGDGPGPYGSKGLGESSIITVAPAIANAVAAATGSRIRDLPLTAAKVWAAASDADRSVTAPAVAQDRG